MAVIGAIFWLISVACRNDKRMTPFAWIMFGLGCFFFLIGIPGIIRAFLFFARFA